MRSIQNLQKFIQILLVFFVGGVASLTYFDAFLPGHDHQLHPYHVSLFEQPDHHHNPLPDRTELIANWLAVNLSGQTHSIGQPFAFSSATAQFFQSGLSRGYLLMMVDDNLRVNRPFLGRVQEEWLQDNSAWLPPPLKPPPSYSVV
jgi:hypothetical protein